MGELSSTTRFDKGDSVVTRYEYCSDNDDFHIDVTLTVKKNVGITDDEVTQQLYRAIGKVKNYV